VLRKEWSIVGWFKGSKRAGRHAGGATRRERRAAERTAKAEASLQETEQKIHRLADEVRADLKDSS
jgi:hypothetical protein